ncbi:MAG: caspase family protein, partial [Runella zeae]
LPFRHTHIHTHTLSLSLSLLLRAFPCSFFLLAEGASPFSTALSTRLTSTPNTHITEVFRLVTSDVRDATRGDQVPYLESSLVDNVYFFST